MVSKIERYACGLCLKMVLLLIDIDECSEGTDGCAQRCSNTIGSYTCSCNAGYTPTSNGRVCRGEETYNLFATLNFLY